MSIKVYSPTTQDLLNYWKNRCKKAEMYLNVLELNNGNPAKSEIKQQWIDSKKGHPEYVTYGEAVALKEMNYEGTVDAYYRKITGTETIVFYETTKPFPANTFKDHPDMWAAPYKDAIKGYSNPSFFKKDN